MRWLYVRVMHVHVMCADGEAKFWLEPQVELARNHRLSRHQIKEIEVIVEVHQNEFVSAWQRVFGG